MLARGAELEPGRRL